MARATDRETSATIGRIPEIVAANAGVDPAELPPIYDVIDPDALESLLDPERAGDVLIEFSYYGYDIHISCTDAISIDRTEPANG